jgi:lysophospholipase L1-like esterase
MKIGSDAGKCRPVEAIQPLASGRSGGPAMQQLDPDDVLRGVLPGLSWSGGSRLPSPQVLKLPADTVRAARIPAGVHLAVRGSASFIDLVLRLGPPTSVPAPTLREGFALRANGIRSTTIPLPPASGTVRIPLPERHPDQTVQLYLPEHREVTIDAVAAIGGELVPAPRGPRWVVYGDSITQGWSVSEPGWAWPSLVAERLGLDLINLGFAGAARGETLVADVIAGSGAQAVALAWGTNAWSSLPTDAGALEQTLRLFLTTLRQGLPQVPVVLLSPIVRPDAEAVPNRYGLTHARLRQVLEAGARAFADENLTLVEGLGLVRPDQLADGIHPGDAGQAALAAGVAPSVAAGLNLSLSENR